MQKTIEAYGTLQPCISQTLARQTRTPNIRKLGFHSCSEIVGIQVFPTRMVLCIFNFFFPNSSNMPQEILSRPPSWLFIQLHEQTPLVNLNAHSGASQQYNVVHGNSQTQKATSNFKRPSITVGMPLKVEPVCTYIISKRYLNISEKTSLC